MAAAKAKEIQKYMVGLCDKLEADLEKLNKFVKGRPALDEVEVNKYVAKSISDITEPYGIQCEYKNTPFIASNEELSEMGHGGIEHLIMENGSPYLDRRGTYRTTDVYGAPLIDAIPAREPIQHNQRAFRQPGFEAVVPGQQTIPTMFASIQSRKRSRTNGGGSRKKRRGARRRKCD